MNFTVAEEERYEFIARTVKRFGYGRLKPGDKAVVLRFLERVSGYSRAAWAIKAGACCTKYGSCKGPRCWVVQ